MSARLRFAVYRDRAPLSPVYLGDVLAADRDAAERAGASTYGGRVVVHRSAKEGHVSPELERVVRAVTKRDSRNWRAARGRDYRGGHDA
jgi:hypothetical protein